MSIEERRVQLVTEVDNRAVRPGFNQITREAGAMAEAVAERSRRAENAVNNIGSGAARSATQVDAAGRNLIGSIQRQTAALEAGSRSGSAYYEVLARQRGIDPAILAPYLARMREVEAAQARVNQQTRAGTPAVRELGVSAAQTAAALRGVPAQMTDIIVGLQGGQAPLTVLLQQGGQLKDMFGGAGAAARALGGYVLGLVNPYTVAAGAAAALAYAHHEGAAEAKAYRLALALTGNAAGATADGMADAARRIGEISGNQGAAAAALASLAETGRVPAQSMQRFADVTVQAQKVMGRSVSDTVADFAALGKAPLSALEEINSKYRFITAATYRQVKALSDQGRAAEAANVAQNAYADGIEKQKQRVLDSLTSWERGWIRIKTATSGAVDSVLDIGRERTNFEEINHLLQRREAIEIYISRAKAARNEKDVAFGEANLLQNQKDINALRSKGDAQKAAAAEAAKSVLLEELQTKWAKDGDMYLDRKAQREKEIVRIQNEGKAAGIPQREINDRVAAARKKYADLYNAGIESNIEKLKQREAIEDVLTQRIIARISATKGLGATGEESAIEAIAKADDNAFERKIAALKKEKAIAADKQNSDKEQKAFDGQIAVLEEERINRRLQLGYDLQQQTRNSLGLYADQLDQLRSSRDAAIQQVQGQKDYNEEIGKTALELLFLRTARSEELAVRLDARARAADAEDLTGEKARIIREEAAAIRERAAEERAGFVKQRDPYVQIRASLLGYRDDAVDSGRQIGDAMTNAFRGAEDAFVSFVTTGKVNFAGLATSIIGDLARIQAKKALAGLVDMAINFVGGQSSTGAGSTGWDGYANIPKRELGGPVTNGTSYLVGEKGPEIFTPSTSGRIIANHALGSAGGGTSQPIIQTTINMSNGTSTTSNAGDSSAQGRALADMVNTQVKDVLAREQRQGGLLWKMQQGRA